MQMTFLPFWLRIVSTAMEVLPVSRSPMMSSRWPRPIGNIASIARMPVSIGRVTPLRSTMPGAGRSSGKYSFASMGPLPSMGAPSGSIMRPRMRLLIGTPAVRFVRSTMSPAEICDASENRITPAVPSARRSCTRPLAPPGKNTISP